MHLKQLTSLFSFASQCGELHPGGHTHFLKLGFSLARLHVAMFLPFTGVVLRKSLPILIMLASQVICWEDKTQEALIKQKQCQTSAQKLKFRFEFPYTGFVTSDKSLSLSGPQILIQEMTIDMSELQSFQPPTFYVSMHSKVPCQ